MSGSEKSPGPAKKPAKKPGKTQASGSGKTTGKTAGTKTAEKPTPRRRVLNVLKWLLVTGLVFAVILAGIGYFAYRNTSIPDANKAFEAQSSFVYWAGGKGKIGRFADQNRESIPLADIPQSMQDAAIAAEDRTF